MIAITKQNFYFFPLCNLWHALFLARTKKNQQNISKYILKLTLLSSNIRFTTLARILWNSFMSTCLQKPHREKRKATKNLLVYFILFVCVSTNYIDDKQKPTVLYNLPLPHASDYTVRICNVWFSVHLHRCNADDKINCTLNIVDLYLSCGTTNSTDPKRVALCLVFDVPSNRPNHWNYVYETFCLLSLLILVFRPFVPTRCSENFLFKIFNEKKIWISIVEK